VRHPITIHAVEFQNNRVRKCVVIILSKKYQMLNLIMHYLNSKIRKATQVTKPGDFLCNFQGWIWSVVTNKDKSIQVWMKESATLLVSICCRWSTRWGATVVEHMIFCSYLDVEVSKIWIWISWRLKLQDEKIL